MHLRSFVLSCLTRTKSCGDGGEVVQTVGGAAHGSQGDPQIIEHVEAASPESSQKLLSYRSLERHHRIDGPRQSRNVRESLSFASFVRPHRHCRGWVDDGRCYRWNLQRPT